MKQKFSTLVAEMQACQICAEKLPHPPRPVFQVSPNAHILIAGQAPGIRVHQSGIPFDDPSGDRLRQWMGIVSEDFYNPEKVAIVPMGFCYPGKGKSGDLPPRKECAEAWRKRILQAMPNIELTLLIGAYAIKWHLGKQRKSNLTETVKAWQSYAPAILPMPHPSPRNNLWLRRNPWFEAEVVPYLHQRSACRTILSRFRGVVGLRGQSTARLCSLGV